MCLTSDGADLNVWMVSSGWALAYRKYDTRYVPEEESVKANRLGIWQGRFIKPWEWRREKRRK